MVLAGEVVEDYFVGHGDSRFDGLGVKLMLKPSIRVELREWLVSEQSTETEVCLLVCDSRVISNESR